MSHDPSQQQAQQMNQAHDLTIHHPDPSLYNEDLAPIPRQERKWGWFEIFNVWSNDIQSLFGYSLAASLFISYGLNGWAVMAAIILAGFIVMLLVNLSGRPSVQYGIPFPVMIRASMGTQGANLPAMLRAIVGIFWYGVQTYFASTALHLLLTALFGDSGTPWLGMTPLGWIAFIAVWCFQLLMFWRGIEWIKTFLNWAGPLVYIVMVLLMVVIWYQAGDDIFPAIAHIFSGASETDATTNSVGAFFAITGTMIAYFAAVVINFGDFSRFVRNESEMKKGNLIGLPLNLAFFSFITLMITAGTLAVFGKTMTNPTDIVAHVDSLPLTLLAAVTFFAATVGINLVANFIPPAYDLANLMPNKINFKTGGLITALIAFVIGGLWVSLISKIGIPGFVNAIGAVIAPFFGIIVADFYRVRRQTLDIQALFSTDPDSAYHYVNGWNRRALIAFALAACFSLSAIWVPSLAALNGYAWLIGAALGGIFYTVLMFRQTPEHLLAHTTP